MNFEKKGIKLFNDLSENHMKIMEDSSVDLIYTDPPYEMNYLSNIPGDKTWNKTGESESRFEKAIDGDQGGTEWESFWKECHRVMKDGSFLFLHHNMPFLIKYGDLIQKCGFEYKGTVAWNKRFAIGGGLKTTMKREWEPISYFSKGKAEFNPVKVMRGKPGKEELADRKRISEIVDWVFSLKKAEKCGHPTQKPVKLAEQVINLTTKPGDVIFDPFGGSGTTGVAALNLGRKAVIVELDSGFFEIAKKRIENT